MRVGVVALQGAAAPHLAALARAGHEARPVRRPDELERADGLVLPGGESTAQALLMRANGLDEALRAHLARGRPVLATCAGLILAARSVDGEPGLLGALGVEVARNAWGRQLDSFEATDDAGELHLVLIRAPRIAAVDPGVEVLARYRDEPVLVRDGAVVGATFHPELTSDPSVHHLAFG